MAEIKFINGKETNFADIICEYKKNQDRNVIVTTFGISIKQIEKLLYNFKTVEVIVDESQSKLNKNMFDRIVILNKQNDNFILKCASIHSKLAIVDNEKLIITSANLTNNQKIESYFFIDTKNIIGMNKILSFIKNIPADSFLKGRRYHKDKRDSLNNDNMKNNNFKDFDFGVWDD